VTNDLLLDASWSTYLGPRAIAIDRSLQDSTSSRQQSAELRDDGLCLAELRASRNSRGRRYCTIDLGAPANPHAPVRTPLVDPPAA